MELEKNTCNLYKGGQVVFYAWVRFFATLCVVIGHSSYLNIQTGFGGVNYQLPSDISPVYFSHIFEILRKLSGWVYGFHMPLFFILSGAVLNIKPLKNYDLLVKSKINRLVIPFFVYGFLFMLPVKFLGNFYNKDSILSAIRAFSFGGESGHLWFLLSLFWCITIFTLIKKSLNKFNISSYAVLLIISLFIQFNYQKIPFDFLSLKSGLSYIFYFAVGFNFETIRERFESISKKSLLLLFILFTTLIYIDYRISLFDSFPVIFIRSLWIFILSLVFEKFFSNVYECNITKIVFRNLFNIYLFHDPLNYLFLRLFFSGRFEIYRSSLGVLFYYVGRTIGVVVISIILGESVRMILNRFKGRNC